MEYGIWPNNRQLPWKVTLENMAEKEFFHFIKIWRHKKFKSNIFLATPRICKIKKMENVFKSFCAFGSRKDESVELMDNAKFSKLARDLKLLDKKLTSTDVDIIFNKVKR